jgi:hypothetical protein
MLSSLWKFVVVALIVIPVSLTAVAERPTRLPTTGTNPRESPNPRHPPTLTRSAGYIFAGTVQSVERVAPKRNGIATVQISFRVDQAMLGVRAGQTLAIREWAGLWELGERYRSGERVLLFLYPPSKLGLTSPVRGPSGRFRIGPDGQVVIDPRRIGVPIRRPGIGGRLSKTTSVSPRELVRFLRSAGDE